jgi:flagellar protein FlbD
MIHVTRLNRTGVVLNSDLIEEIETTPDTVISLTTGQKIMVLESTEEIVERIRRYRQSILAGLPREAQCLSSPPAMPSRKSQDVSYGQSAQEEN